MNIIIKRDAYLEKLIEKKETELRPLKNTKDFFKKIIITKTLMKSWTDEEGILHLGLYEFLLNENSLEL